MAARERMEFIRPLLVYLILCGFIQSYSTLEVVHMDTREISSRGETLDWQTYTHTDDSLRAGWRESSWNLQNSQTTRSYVVCNIDVPNVNSWLRTPFIPKGNAHRLFLEIQFTMRRCTNFHTPDELQQCKESVKLYYYQAESDFANENMPTWDSETYTLLDTLAADETFESAGGSSTVINTETRDVEVVREGVYFAFQDLGACANIAYVKIYSIMCPSVTARYAIFPNTTAGPRLTSIVPSHGVCVDHAAIETQPSYLCRSDGTWYYPTGGCQCMPGYQPQNPGAPLEEQNACQACPSGHYKWSTGDQTCEQCPSHSVADSEAAVECLCEDRYYRSENDDKAMPCTQPPSSPRNLTLQYSDQSSLNLTWLDPLEDGGRRDLVYHVECVGCPSTYKCTPTCNQLNRTNILIEGLNPNTRYKIVVYARNGVSDISNTIVSDYVTVHTKSTGGTQDENRLPSETHKVSVSSVGPQGLLVKWKTPDIGHPILMYILHYYPGISPKDNVTIYTHRLNYTLKNLLVETQYIIHVRWNSTTGPGEYQAVSYNTGVTKSSVSNDKDNSIPIIAGAAVAVLVCMCIVIVMVLIFLRRNHRACNEKNVSDCDSLQYSNGKIAPVVEGGMHTLPGTVPLFPPMNSFKQYFDPHEYEDPNQAVRDFTKEIDASLITIESVIGGGEFGDVCKGYMRHDECQMTVAIKTLKPGASDKNRLDFLTEASIMGQFENPNVIYLKGVVTKNNPIMIVTEYMENASLDNFLRQNDGKFTIMQLIGMMRGVASGMAYLAEMGYVHRDLAARNILVNDTLVCKVADFGLSREIESDDTDGAYTTKGGKIPVRWTAPEAIAYRKFTSASDVWSYGVVMWEIIAYGERPYWNWSNQDVIKAIEKDYRLPPPMDCPEMTYQLMLDCWQKERTNRPKFDAIVNSLDKLIRSPELLKRIAKVDSYMFGSNNSSIYDSQHQQDSLLTYPPPQYPTQQIQNAQFGGCGTTIVYDTVDNWLIDIKMQRYLDVFNQAGYLQMDQVALITKKDLEALGINLAGHQNKILKSVASLRLNLSDTSGHHEPAMFV